MHGIDFIKDLAVVLLVAGLVGWACHRVGLSAVVGYLVAGMVVGPYTPPFSLVSDISRIETLAQVGLVFLMFSIGMGLSLRKLRRLGLSLVLATFAGAIVMYNLTRVLGGLMGWSPVETAFLAAMLMVSSSAIISKVLHDIGAMHEKSGQMALGVSVLEDVVAIVMLAILNSLIQIDAKASISLTLGLLGAFITLAGIGGMLVVPWLLRKLSLSAGEELPTIVVAGLLFVLAFLADRAGFSLALGAFMLGAIIAETPHKTQIGRAFDGMRDVFSAVFFVSIGMLIDLHAVKESGLLILGITLFVLVARPLAVTFGVLLIGGSTRESLRVGLSVTALGEFSFIIAQLGVSSGALPPGKNFQALAVGVSLLTTLASPLLSRRSEAISDWIASRQPHWLEALEGYYHRWLERLQQRERKSMLWQLSKKRFIQIGVEILLVTGLFVFSEQMFGLVRDYLPVNSSFPRGAEVIFWSVLLLLALAPVVAIWRNTSALALLYAQVSTQGHPKAAKLAPVVETGLKMGAGLLLFLWITALLPISGVARWLPVVALAVIIIAFFVLRRRLVYWHSMLEVELETMLSQGEKFTGTTAPWMAPHADWNLTLGDCLLPDLADARGRTLGELALRTKFGCTVAGVERQGVMVGNPTGDMVLYPRDKVLLLGTHEQVVAGKEFLHRASGAPSTSNFDEVRMESVELPPGCGLHGRTLAELALGRQFGLQVAGVNRGGLRILNPHGEEKLFSGDNVLVLGSPDQIAAFKATLRK